MTKDTSQTVDKSISDPDFLQLWRGLSRNQQRFAVAMLEYPSKKQAALAIGVEPDTVYRWPPAVDIVIDVILGGAAMAAHKILEDSVVKAAMIKRGGLDSDDEKMRQVASDAIMDRVMGKPTQHQEFTGVLKSLDLRALTTEQLERIASGEDVLHVLATPGKG